MKCVRWGLCPAPREFCMLQGDPNSNTGCVLQTAMPVSKGLRRVMVI